MYETIIPKTCGFVNSKIAKDAGADIALPVSVEIPGDKKRPANNRIAAWETHKAASAKTAAKMLSVHYRYKRWAKHAQASGNDAQAWEYLQVSNKFFERGQRMYNCANFILHGRCPDCGRTHTSSAMLCRDRVCPTCNWRLSLQQACEMQQALAYITDLDQYKAAFVTLTLRNCAVEDLKGTLELMAAGWNRMLARKQPKILFKGWARRVEITYNNKAHTFHPHYHAIFLVPAGAAQDAAAMHAMIRDLWRSALRIDYDPVTDFQWIEDLTAGGQDENATPELHKAILETFKYTIKDDAMGQMPLDTFRAFVEGINGKRLTAYGGVIKDARAALDFSDELQDEQQDACSGCANAALQRVIFRWSFASNTYERFENIVTAALPRIAPGA